MKKSLRIISLLNIAILFCYFIGNCSNSFAATETYSPIDKSTQDICYFKNQPANTFGYAINNENNYNCFNNLTSSSQKNKYYDFATCGNSTASAIENTVSEYIYYIENIVVRFSQTDIIFPFHNFW